MSDSKTPPFQSSYWLPSGQLLAGQYPGTMDPEGTRAKLSRLLDAGVTTFIDLTEETEPLEAYHGVLREVAAERSIEARHIRIPIRDAGTPRPGVMEKVLDTISAEQAEGRIAYVHCWGGIGRTGTVVACHLVECGQTADDALDLVQKLFEGYKRDRPPFRSPETPSQCDFVRAWKSRTSVSTQEAEQNS
jgi:protein-tyrosine phosphatase